MNEATLTTVLTDGRWGWLDWAIIGGLALLIVGFIVAYTLLTKNIFNRQLAILGKVVDERARTLYLEHLPVVNQRLDAEVVRLEKAIAERVEAHDKDVLFLLQEQERIESMLKGYVPEKTLKQVKLSKEEQAEQALRVLLARIRREAM